MVKCKEKGCNRTDIKSKKKGLCSIHYARWYRKTYPERIRPTKKAYYSKNRDKLIQGVKNWVKRHPDYYKTRKRGSTAEDLRMQAVRYKTIGHFKHLRDNGKCEECTSIKNLEFHHLEPYAYDNFRILCKRCHMATHGKIFIEMDDTKANLNENGGKDEK
ncbi:MAG: hypothetical protein AABY22_33735 [Nanoarchaeota archaeon]